MSRRKQASSISAVIVGLLLYLLTQHLGLLQTSKPTTPVASKPKTVTVTPTPGYYNVTEFVDGDTIGVDFNGVKEKVRLIGVDTPETHDPRKNVQCFGSAAADFTKQLIGTSPVRMESDPTNDDRDRYQRLLRYVYLQDGRLVNAEIIKQGYGFAYTVYPFTKMEEFRGYETAARSSNLGLWGTCAPIPGTNGQLHSNDAN